MQKVSKIGIVLPHFGSSQASYYAIQYANSLILSSNNYDVTLFYEEIVLPCVKPLCATMNISELWNFDGLIVSTTIRNAISASKAITSAVRVFYIWDLEWLRQGKNDYKYNLMAYRAENTNLIARSVSHALAIENYCNRKVSAIIPEFNIGTIIGTFMKV